MNILIMTARCGMGHYSASDAIIQEIKLKNDDVNIIKIDFFEYMFPKMKHIIYGFFNFMVKKCSYIYNLFYKITSKKVKIPLENKVIKKIKKLIENEKIDVVISTFPVCSSYIAKYKNKSNSNIKLYTYITDIDANEEWIAEGTDKYCVSSKRTKNELKNKGINDEKIIITGIPIKQNFKHECSEQIEKNKKEILIMGGGLGLIPALERIINDLSKEENIHINLIAGTNKTVIKKYKDKYENVDVIGYTNEVNKYMEIADLIITKAGGITLFESIYMQTPLYIITPFLSQEIGNAKFIEANNIGKVIWNKKENNSKEVLDILNNDKKLNLMKNNMKEIKENLESINILELCEEGAM